VSVGGTYLADLVKTGLYGPYLDSSVVDGAERVNVRDYPVEVSLELFFFIISLLMNPLLSSNL
jgi:hypothetical protein